MHPKFIEASQNTFPTESVKDISHTTTVSGVVYDVFRLIHLTKDIPITHVPTGRLQRDLRFKCWVDTENVHLAPVEIYQEYRKFRSWKKLIRCRQTWTDHIYRTRNADCSYPLLIHLDEGVIDGMHRLLKACLEKREILTARYFNKLPRQALYIP